MRRYIVLLLITGIVWAQTDFDKLVLKNGTTYFGEYSKTEGDRVYFKHQDALAFQPVPVELIKQLQLKDGQIIIVRGRVQNSLTLDEYQKLSTKEKAIYDANLYAASLATPYFVFNKNEKFNFPKSILTDSEKEIYEQAYSKNLKQRKIKYAVGSICIFVGVIGLLALGSFKADFSSADWGGSWGPAADPK